MKVIPSLTVIHKLADTLVQSDAFNWCVEDQYFRVVVLGYVLYSSHDGYTDYIEK